MPECFVVRPELSEIARLAAWAETAAADLGLAASGVFALQVCLEEHVSNVIRHGAADAPIRVSLAETGGGVLAVIEDAGAAFDPLAMAAPATPDSIGAAPIGGLGIGLIRSFASDVSYQRVGGANRLSLRFDRS